MSESFLELTTAYRIEVWRERMKGGALFAPEDIENLIGRIAHDDAVLASFIREAMAIARVSRLVDHAAELLHFGDIDGASQALDPINRDYQYVDERIRKMRGIEMGQVLVEASVAPFVEKERQSKEQKRKAGGADKTRKWAERLARQFNTGKRSLTAMRRTRSTIARCERERIATWQSTVMETI